MDTSSGKYLKHISTGDILLRQGDPGACAYVVEHGKLEVLTEHEGETRVVARVGTGGMVGEMSLISGHPHAATVRAVEPTRLVRISREHLDERLDEADPLLRHILQVVMTRFRDLLQSLNGGDGCGERTEGSLCTHGAHDRARALGHLQIENQVAQALAEGQLELHYQPIVRMADNTVAGFESLIRWRRPGYARLVPPGRFIPIVERSSLILDVGRWAMDRSAADLGRLGVVARQTQPQAPPLKMNVNLAVRQFSDPDLFGTLREVLDRHAIAPAQYQLEITESTVLSNWDVVRDLLFRARDLGVNVAIDDFGSGYSSLAYLHRLPANTLKLDAAFVRDLGNNRSSAAIVASMARLGRELGMAVVAEGVETREQSRMLRAAGVEFVQGYHYGRPMPCADAEMFLRGAAAEVEAPAVCAAVST